MFVFVFMLSHIVIKMESKYLKSTFLHAETYECFIFLCASFCDIDDFWLPRTKCNSNDAKAGKHKKLDDDDLAVLMLGGKAKEIRSTYTLIHFNRNLMWLNDWLF